MSASVQIQEEGKRGLFMLFLPPLRSSNLRTKYHTPNTTPNTTYNATPTHHHGLQARKYPKRASMLQPSKVQTHRDTRSASPTLWLTCRNELAGSGNRSMGWLRSSCRCLASGTDNRRGVFAWLVGSGLISMRDFCHVLYNYPVLNISLRVAIVRIVIYPQDICGV